MNNQMEESEASILHTYNRFPVVFERGEGVHLYDSEGAKYLDFAAGIAVNSLGYHYPGYDEALKNQIDKLTHISNLYYNEPIIEAGAKLVNASRMDKAFFTNSGTEAIEGALKAAKKYAYINEYDEKYLPVKLLQSDINKDARKNILLKMLFEKDKSLINLYNERYESNNNEDVFTRKYVINFNGKKC